MDIKKIAQIKWTKHFVTCLLIGLAVGLRIWPLGALELRIPWVTFYPAVMAASLYGGFYNGILGTLLTIAAVLIWSPTGDPFIDDPGDILGMTVFFVNGTLISLMSGAMHKARKSALEARAQAEAANRAKSVFLANMSHELRSLLKNSNNISSDQLENLNIISNSGNHLLNLINNVLDISKIEAGHMEKENSVFNLHQLLYQVKSMMSVRMEEKNLKFSIKTMIGNCFFNDQIK